MPKLVYVLAEMVWRRRAMLRYEDNNRLHFQEARFDLEEKLLKLVKDRMPSGSGFDSGTSLDLEACNENKLVFHTDFHHMNEHGFYTHWTPHKVIVKPDFISEFTISVFGRNSNNIKPYIQDMFFWALDQEIDTDGM